MNVLYTARTTARGGREGEVVSDDGVIDLELVMPTELGGPGGDKTNPEQLFAVGSFHSAVKRIAGQEQVVCPYSSATRGNVAVQLEVAG